PMRAAHLPVHPVRVLGELGRVQREPGATVGDRGTVYWAGGGGIELSGCQKGSILFRAVGRGLPCPGPDMEHYAIDAHIVLRLSGFTRNVASTSQRSPGGEQMPPARRASGPLRA